MSFEGWSWFKFNILGLALGMALTFYNRVAKEVKLKVGKFWWLILLFRDVAGKKLRKGFKGQKRSDFSLEKNGQIALVKGKAL